MSWPETTERARRGNSDETQRKIRWGNPRGLRQPGRIRETGNDYSFAASNLARCSGSILHYAEVQSWTACKIQAAAKRHGLCPPQGKCLLPGAQCAPRRKSAATAS